MEVTRHHLDDESKRRLCDVLSEERTTEGLKVLLLTPVSLKGEQGGVFSDIG